MEFIVNYEKDNLNFRCLWLICLFYIRVNDIASTSLTHILLFLQLFFIFFILICRLLILGVPNTSALPV